MNGYKLMAKASLIQILKMQAGKFALAAAIDFRLIIKIDDIVVNFVLLN